MEEDLEEQDPVTLCHLYFCPHCEEEIEVECESVAMEIVVLRTDGPNTIVKDDAGNYSFRPYLLHLSCWEWLESEMREEAADRPPSATNPPRKCSTCEDMLTEDDPCADVTVGELRESKVDGLTFQRHGHLATVCVLCLQTAVETYLDGWDELHEFLPMEK